MRRSHLYLIAALVVTFVLFNVPYGQYVLYPFKLFATWLHETGHGVTALLVGGDFDHMVIRADTSGTAYHSGASGVTARALVASAGYLGTSFFGALLLLLGGASERRARLALYGIAIALLLVLVLFVRNLFGFFAVGGMGLLLLAVAWKAPPTAASALLNLLAAQSCVNAILDIRSLFAIGDRVVAGQGRSDAATMQELLLIPYWFWAAAWMFLSVLLLAVTLYWQWRRERSSLPARRQPARGNG